MSYVWLWLCDVQMKCCLYHSQPSGAEMQHSTILIIFMDVQLRIESLLSCFFSIHTHPKPERKFPYLHRLWQLQSLCIFIKSKMAVCKVSERSVTTSDCLSVGYGLILYPTSAPEMVPYVQ